MSAQLLNPIHSLKSTLRRLAVVRGTALSLTLLLCLAIGTGIVDWLIHVDDHMVRLGLGLSICGVAGVAVWRWVLHPVMSRLTDLQIARRIESVYPEFGGRISSSVDFVHNPAAGSDELQRQTIVTATREITALDREQLVDRQPARHASLVALLACVLTVTLFGVRSTEARIGLRRLLFPFETVPWPRTTDLRLIDEDGVTRPPRKPMTVVRGEYFELLVENTMGSLPDDAVVEYRVGARGVSRFEPLRPITLDVETTGEVGRVILSPGGSPVYLRACGGDHWSPWYRLDVVRPPRTVELDITVTHPEYTGRGAERLPTGTTAIEALVGSRVDIQARVSKPVGSAEVILYDRAVETDVARDRKSLTASFVLEREGVSAWWIALTDLNGVVDPRPTRYELRAVRDAPPSVFIERPVTDIQATASATVPLRATATDDQGVARLSVDARIGDADAPPMLLPLTATGSDSAETVTVVGELKLQPLGLTAGDRVLLHAVASDQKTTDPAHQVSSEPRQILIVTSAVKAAELAESHTRLLDEMQRVVDSQVRARDSVAELQIQQREAGALRRPDLDLLKRTELDQHRIKSALFDESIGLRERIQRLLDDFDANSIDSPEVRAQLTEVLGELDHVYNRVATALESELASIRKDVEDAVNDSGDENTAVVGDAEPRLGAIQDLQTDVVDSLSALLEGAESWMRRVDVQSSLTTLGSRQDELNRDTAGLVERSLKSDSEADRRQQAADAARLARRQQRLADKLDGLLEELDDAIAELEATGAKTEDRLKSAQDFAKSQTPSVGMREAASELSAGRAAAAATLQQQAADQIQQLHEILNGQSATEFDTALDNLDQAEAELRQLRTEQAALADALEENFDPAETARRQAELRSRTQRQRRQLDRLLAEDAAAAAAEAADKMQESEQSLRENDAAAARDAADKATDALDRSLQATRQRRQQIEQQATQQSVLQVVSALDAVIADQQRLLDSTRDAEGALQQRGRRTRQQSRAVLKLAADQNKLANTLLAAGARIEDAPVVALALESAAANMERAGDRLALRDTSAETTGAQQAAIDELTSVVQAFADADTDSSSDDLNANSEETQETAGDQDPLPLLVKLKLLRSLQQRVNQQTTALSETEPRDPNRLAELAERQKQITRIATDLLEQLNAAEPR